mgnify:CR=1 FL=1
MSAPHHIRLVAHPARRAPGHTDWPGDTTSPVPALAELVEAANANRPAGITWLSGGEPTLRSDLPQLVRALSEAGHTVGLDTDGLALTRIDVVKVLQQAGLTHLRLSLHSTIPDAHDWIEGTKGAARRVRRAAKVAQALGLSLAGQVLVARSTTDHLVDTVRILAALGATRIHLRRPRRRGAAAGAFITVSPRLGLAEPYLEAAIARGKDSSVPVRLDGFPRCAAPRAREAAFTHDRELWVVPGSLAILPAFDLTDTLAPGCARCTSACPGAPADYVGRFGRLELDDPGLSPTARPQPSPPVYGQTPAEPPARAGRSPATRLRYAVRQASTPDLGGDPLAGVSTDRALQAEARLSFEGDPRDIKIEMVRLAQTGIQHVIVDEPKAFDRPEAHAMLRELVRLGIPQLTVAGDLRALGKRSKRSLKRLAGIHHWVVELWSPEAEAHDALAGDGDHDAVLKAGTALSSATGASWGVRGLLPARPTSLDAWTTAWNELSGEPAFRFVESPDPSWTTAQVPEPLVDAVNKALQSAGLKLESGTASA